MNPALRARFHFTRILLASTWFLLCLSTVAAPILAGCGHSTPAGVLYLLWSPFCHQDSERSFTLLGHPMAICHRCTGVYAGLFLATLINAPWSRIGFQHRRLVVLLAVLPLLFDTMLPLAGFYHNHAWTRISTGLIFGMAASSFLVTGMAEMVCKNPS